MVGTWGPVAPQRRRRQVPVEPVAFELVWVRAPEPIAQRQALSWTSQLARTQALAGVSPGQKVAQGA